MYEVAKGTQLVAAQSAERGKLPPVFVAQAFEDTHPDRSQLREPSAFENRYMTFAPIIAGARGILYFERIVSSTAHRAEVAMNAAQRRARVPAIRSIDGDGGVTVSSSNDTFPAGVACAASRISCANSGKAVWTTTT